MFRNLFATPRRRPADVADELHALCHAAQIERLVMPKALRHDVGIDCGCTAPAPDLTRRQI